MSSVITAAMLAMMRAAVTAHLDLTCVIKRYTYTPDNYGAQTGVLNVIATVPCGLSSPSGGEMTSYDGIIGSHAMWHVILPQGTSCVNDDRLFIGSLVLTVQIIINPTSFNTSLEVYASEVR